ncbi:MAG: prolyl oligopeptidase family serine peptidase [Armatimonadetes bacterium]|nr:prolyl oligopeptidase family serine peptidase [Armatimonadota bacterium]
MELGPPAIEKPQKTGRLFSPAFCAAATLALACVAATPHVLAQSSGRAHLVWYKSPVDGTDQAYGVYVPVSAAPPGGYPAIFHGHGYGWLASADFSPWQKQWANEHGWVLVNINARGPTLYEGIGQTAIYEVVQDATERFGLDRRRLFFVGGSMGGTGAFREGVRHPDLFAAVVAVDGWGDWRLWHHHWYARTDMRHSIEEFRRPLLCSVAPLEWAENAMWGRVRSVTDGCDTVVWPENSLRLIRRLSELAETQPGAYRHDIVLNYELGHGAGYDLPSAYDFFLRAAPAGLGKRLMVKAWRLAYARQGWVAITRIHQFGLPATAESVTRGPLISVWTDNIDALEVLPAECADVAARGWCVVYVDGFPVYEGQPTLVRVEAVRDASDKIIAWREASTELLTKRPGLEGPIGDAFTQPFIVAYANSGSPEDRVRHRQEAEAFCAEWNNFFVHGPGVEARPEDRLTPREIEEKNLVLFGCLDCSRLLRLAERQNELPIHVHHGRVEVHEDGAARIYHGESFGCIFVYPNPLAGLRRYLVVCSGRWYTGAEGTEPHGLEYDLEKLPWAYPDYVIFNADQTQLPLVLNVNNKPQVQCYEAAYFVEAGYFDNHWQVASDLVCNWVKKRRPEGARIVHVAEVLRDQDRVRVRVVDENGVPVPQARVTVGVHYLGSEDRRSTGFSPSDTRVSYCRSTVTGPDGQAWFDDVPHGVLCVVNVMGTGCAYDRGADCPQAHPLPECPELAGRYLGPPCVDVAAPVVKTEWELATLAERMAVVRVHPEVPFGEVRPIERKVCLRPGARERVGFDWMPGYPPAGTVRLALEIGDERGQAAKLSARVELRGVGPGAVAIRELKAEQRSDGCVVEANIGNASTRPQELILAACIVQAALPLGTRRVWLDPRSEEIVRWRVPDDVGRFWSGPATVRVCAPHLFGCSKDCEIVLKAGEAEHFATAN